MKVKWEQFAQRRKINLEMFKSMSYEDYADWCNFRRVEPVSKDAYEGVQSMLTKPKIAIPIEVTTESTHKFKEQQLKRMRKTAIVNLCKEFEISVNNTDTKRQLIKKLLALNNA
tara:strand:+ start:2536 stop:2877 length:342 start_codon:yes stop_codon:yes gene_type:complete